MRQEDRTDHELHTPDKLTCYLQSGLPLSPNSQIGHARQDRRRPRRLRQSSASNPQVTDLACPRVLASLAFPAVQRLARTSHQAKRGWRVAIRNSLFPSGL